IAPLAGSIEYRRRGAEPATLDVLYHYVPNQGTAWNYTLDELSRYFERVAALSRESPPAAPPPIPLIGACDACSADWFELACVYCESARLLGRRTAALHQALASAPLTPPFAPESFGKLYQRSLYQGLRNAFGKLCRRLERVRHDLPSAAVQPVE